MGHIVSKQRIINDVINSTPKFAYKKIKSAFGHMQGGS